MKRQALLVAASLSLVSVIACGKAQPPQQAQQAAQQNPAIPKMGKPVVEVPASVKGKWKAVVLVVEEKDKKAFKEHTVGIGEKYTMPGSDLSIEVKEFFPSFVMQGSSITSISNEPNNPAAQVVVSEGGSEVFNGWLFAKYPTTHAFSHPKYAITLKEGVAK